MMKRLGLAIILLAIVVLAGCGGGAAKEPTKGDVIVYVAVPLSGFQANGGQTVLGGVRLAAEQINRSGGLFGYRVVVRPLDDESDSDVAVAQVAVIQDALNKGERVIAVIGHLNSGQTLAAMELYKGSAVDRHHTDGVRAKPQPEGLHQLLPRQRQRRCAGRRGRALS